MASNGDEDGFLHLCTDIDSPSLEQVLLEQDPLTAEPWNDGDGHPVIFGGQSDNNAEAPDQQDPLTAKPWNDGDGHPVIFGGQSDNNAEAPDQQNAQAAVARPHTQDDSNGTLDSSSVLHLKLEKKIYFEKKFESMPCKGQVDHRSSKAHAHPKFKATSEPFCVLRIGRYEVRPRYPSHLVAKWYFTKKQLNWEILEGGLKKKIEIKWSDISALRVEYGGNMEILEIELWKQPQFYRETEVHAKKHTSWKPSTDFTDGQAWIYRRHHLEFPGGTLQRNMEQLFMSDSHLRELSGRPFPSSESPFFAGYAIGTPQSALPLINPELIQLHHHRHHQLPPAHSRVSTSFTGDEPMISVRDYERQSANHQTPPLENPLTSQVSDYGLAPPLSLPTNGTIFNGQFMGRSPAEQFAAPSSFQSGKVKVGTSHGKEGYNYPSNLMMASKDGSYPSAEMNIARHAHTWNSQGIFSRDAWHHRSGLASSLNASAMDVPSSPGQWHHVRAYGFAPSLSLPTNGTIFNGQFMGHSPAEQFAAPSSFKSGNVKMGTSHGNEGHNYPSNPSNLMMASKDGSYATAEMNVVRSAHTWNNQGFFSQDARHCSGLASSSDAPALDVPSSPGNHAHAHGGLIYPGFVANHDHDDQHHPLMMGHINDDFPLNKHME